MKAKHPTTTKPHHIAHLSAQVANYAGYLDHADPAVRLVGLRALHEYIDALITQEYATVRPRTTARPAHANWKRAIAEDIDARIAEGGATTQPESILTRIRRFFHALPYVD